MGHDDTRPTTRQMGPMIAPSRELVDAAADPLEASIDREEHVAAVRRFRVATRIGMLAWIAYCSLVWLIDWWVHPGSLRSLLLLHACGLAITIAVHLWIRNRIPSRLEL